jgi:hypothetical protein
MPAVESSEGVKPRGVHERSGVIDAGAVPAFGYCGHGNGALDASQGLEGVDHWGDPPGWHRVFGCLLEP